MRIALLGPLVIDGGVGKIGPRDRVVLAALAVRPGEVSSADKLADALWGERLPASWRTVVQGCVARLRKALGAGTIETLPQGYRLQVSSDELDTLRFERLVGRGRELLTVGEAERASYTLGKALDLWRGEALVDLDGWEAGRVEAGRLDELRLDSEELRLDAALQAGHHLEVLTEAQDLAAAAPLRERRWGLLALAQYQAGRQAEALETLQRVRTVLADELGLDPSPDLIALEQAILQQDPALLVESAPPEPSAICPYRGLMPYDVDDADIFFGRDADLAACLERLSTVGVLAVVGPSGSGKSSLVRAGIAATYRRNGHRIEVVTPGTNPMDALTAMPDRGPVPLLIVDQFEEVFSLCEHLDEQTRFFAALAEHAGRGLLVMALRADRMGAVSAHADVSRLIERGLYLLGAMAEDDLRAAIEGPARQAGLPIEPGLVDLLVREVEGEPGALPLLSHALRETWLRREGRTLTVEGYQATGGIRGAVAQSAEDVYNRVDPDQRGAFRDLLLRLVVPSEAGEPVRSRLPRRLIATDEEREQLIELLVGARLVTSDDGVVELTHEALVRAWPRLREWLDEDADGLRIRHHVTVAADAWEEMDRPDSELYRGVRLTRALDWRDRTARQLTAAEQAFLDASQAHAEDKLRDAVQRAEREARIGRRTRRLAIGLAGVLVLALVAAGLALRYQHDAATRANEATEASRLADANRLAALSKSVGSLDLSLLLAAQAAQMGDTTSTQDGLLSSIMEHRRATRVVQLAGQADDVELAADGRVMFVATHSSIAAWQLGSTSHPVTVNEWDKPLDIASASSGDAVAVWGWTKEFDPKVGVFGSDGSELVYLVGTDEIGGYPQNFGFRPDGDLLISMTADSGSNLASVIREFDVATGKPSRTYVTGLQSNEWVTGTIADDGSSAVSWIEAEPTTARRVDLNTGSSVRIRVQDRPANTLGFVPLSTGLAQRWGDGAVTLYDTGGRPTQVLGVHQAEVNDIAVAPDRSWAASVDDLGAVVLWSIDPASGVWSYRDSLVGHTGAVNGVAIDPSGTKLITASRDGTAISWDVSPTAGFGDPMPGLRNRWISNTPATITPGELVVAPTRPAPAEGVEFLGDAGTLSVFATFLDPSTGRVVDDIRVTKNTIGFNGSSVAVSPAGTAVAVSHGFGATVLDTKTREVLHRIRMPKLDSGDREPVWSVAWTPDGSRLLLGAGGEELNGRDGNLLVVDTDTWEKAAERIDIGGAAQTMELSPDQRLLAVGMLWGPVDNPPPGEVKLLDADTLEVKQRLIIGPGDLPHDVSFSPDGTTLATGGLQGEVAVFDVASGRRLHTPDQAHSEMIAQVEWLPDGRTVVTTGYDGMVSLYDAERGLVRAAMPAAADPAEAYTWLPSVSATEIAALTGAEPGRRYTLDPEQWLEHACQVAGRNLTPDEWASYLGDLPYQQTCPQWD
jgi:WD40 repeat protein/DNA-binding SARP family transcriptional activator